MAVPSVQQLPLMFPVWQSATIPFGALVHCNVKLLCRSRSHNNNPLILLLLHPARHPFVDLAQFICYKLDQ